MKSSKMAKTLSILSAYSPNIHIIADFASGSSRLLIFSHNTGIMPSYLLGYRLKIFYRGIELVRSNAAGADVEYPYNNYRFLYDIINFSSDQIEQYIHASLGG